MESTHLLRQLHACARLRPHELLSGGQLKFAAEVCRIVRLVLEQHSRCSVSGLGLTGKVCAYNPEHVNVGISAELHSPVDDAGCSFPSRRTLALLWLPTPTFHESTFCAAENAIQTSICPNAEQTGKDQLSQHRVHVSILTQGQVC